MLVPSAEQQCIIDAVVAGKNVAVDAVAGSGKTTTVLGIACACAGLEMFQITFNAQLKSEVRAKVVIEGIGNLHVHTYHSLATTFYDRTAYTDAKIIKLIGEDCKIKINTPRVDVLIIDEAQDMTLLYYKLLNKFVRDVGGVGQIVVLGDRYQGVYEFMKADTRFLTLANDIWPGRSFVHLSLQESYRVTEQIAWYINNVMLGEQRILSRKKSKFAVEWYICNLFTEMEGLFLRDLVKQIKSGTLRPDDIFVLTASLKSPQSPTRLIENFLVKSKIPVYVPISDEGRLDDDVTRGKVVFATFPSSKGRERNIVILMGYDQSYFDFYAKSALQDVCPSTLYVAATRAKKRLILVGSDNSSSLSFLDNAQIGSGPFNANTTYINNGLLIKSASKKGPPEKKTSVTDMVKYLTQEAVEYLGPLVAEIFQVVVAPQDKPIGIPSKIKTQNGMSEDVSHLNGLVIPTIWEMQRLCRTRAAATEDVVASVKISTMYRLITSTLSLKKCQKSMMNTAFKKVKCPCTTTSDYLYMANVYWAITEGYHGQLAQITSYDWLSDDIVAACVDVLETQVGCNDIDSSMQFEYNIGATIQTLFGKVQVRGAIDILTHDTVWEVKCTDVLQLEHLLQLVVYAWLHQKGGESMQKYKIINVRTGEVRELDVSCGFKIQNIVDSLFLFKYKNAEKMDDEQFTRQCQEARQKLC